MKTAQPHRRKIRVTYPVTEGTIVLRTEGDWNEDVKPVKVTANKHFDFELEHHRPYIHFKACLLTDDNLRWSVGANELVLLTPRTIAVIFPHFNGKPGGSITDLIAFDSAILGRPIRMRAYLPSGYFENDAKRYPVVLLQDGANVFLPLEAFRGQDWHIQATLDVFDAMNSIEQTIVIGIYAGNRDFDYTKPGYEVYGKSIINEVMPFIEKNFRLKPGRENTMMMGSSLGGVVSFYLGWEYPDRIGAVASLSGTFSYRDDLLDRVQQEDIDARRSVHFYLDSGWPKDNYESTLDMAYALCARGFVLGRDLHHVVFPRAQHTEESWAARCHLPLQLFSGRLRRITRKIS